MNADNANPKVLDARVWQEASLANQYVNEVRAALPLAAEQTAMMLRIVSASVPEPKRFLDLGCGSGILGAAMLDRSGPRWLDTIFGLLSGSFMGLFQAEAPMGASNF